MINILIKNIGLALLCLGLGQCGFAIAAEPVDPMALKEFRAQEKAILIKAPGFAKRQVNTLTVSYGSKPVATFTDTTAPWTYDGTIKLYDEHSKTLERFPIILDHIRS